MLRAYLELLRLPNVFTATADVAMGYFFVATIGSPVDGGRLAMLVGASSLLYCAGMVLNDVFDFEQDARQRPQRPLPSGRIGRGTAARLGWGLLIAGVVLGIGVAVWIRQPWPAVVAVALAGCVVLYDGWLKRTPLGPIAMGGCRMLNVLLGMSVAAAGWGTANLLAAGGIGLYVVGLTWFARGEAGRSSRRNLLSGLAVMIAGVAMLAWLPSWIPLRVPAPRWQLFVLILGVLIAWQCRRALLDPSPSQVQTAVKQCILSLVILDAAVTMAVRGPVPAVMILLLLVPAVLLGQWISST